MQAPQRSASQRNESLALGREMRAKRAQLRDDLKNGRICITDIFNNINDPVVAKMRASLLVKSISGVGPVLAKRIIRDLSIADTRRVGGLGPNQIDGIIDAYIKHSRNSGRLIVVSGPSGVGKDTLVNQVIQNLDDVVQSTSATTRTPREGEIDGVHYHFVDDRTFDSYINEKKLLEWANVHGNKYGTLTHEVRARVAQGLKVILVIDVQGALQIARIIPSAYLIFIQPPSMEALQERLVGRGTENDRAVALRMKNSISEMKVKDQYHFCITNNDLDTAVAELCKVVSELPSEKSYNDKSTKSND